MKKFVLFLLALSLVFVAIGCTIPIDDPAKGDADPTKSTTENAGDLTFSVGEAAVFKTLKVTADSVKSSDGDDMFNKPTEGKHFVGVTFTVENISEEDQSVSSYLLFDAYVDGTKTDQKLIISLEGFDNTLDGTISKGKKLTGTYAVEVATDAAELEIQVKGSWLSSGKAAFVFDISKV